MVSSPIISSLCYFSVSFFGFCPLWMLVRVSSTFLSLRFLMLLRICAHCCPLLSIFFISRPGRCIQVHGRKETGINKVQQVVSFSPGLSLHLFKILPDIPYGKFLLQLYHNLHLCLGLRNIKLFFSFFSDWIFLFFPYILSVELHGATGC